MSHSAPSDVRAHGLIGPAAHGWTQAFLAVAAALVTTLATAALGLWAAGATELPGGAFPTVVAAVAVLAIGGTVDLTGNAGPLSATGVELTVVPLSVTLAGALVLARSFLRPLRLRAVAGARELLGWAARLGVLWAIVLVGLAAVARHSFAVTPAGTVSEIADLLGISAEAGFRADVPLTLLYGLLWLAALLALALLASRRSPLPAPLVRFHAAVRPAAHAMVTLLLVYVAAALVVAVVVAATRGHAVQTVAVVLLGLPNLAWLAMTFGLGASWDGAAEGPFGLPMPKALDAVLRTPGGTTVDLRSLAAEDGRAWWLLIAFAVLMSAAAVAAALRTPAPLRAWHHAFRMAVALVFTVLMVSFLCRVDVSYGLSLFGLGDVGGELAARVHLLPHWGTALGAAALWGLVTGLLSGLLAGALRSRRSAPPG